MSIVVDLPAPFGPSSATVSPGEMSMSTPRTARTGPSGVLKDFVSPLRWMPVLVVGGSARFIVMIHTLPHRGGRRQYVPTPIRHDIRQVSAVPDGVSCAIARVVRVSGYERACRGPARTDAGAPGEVRQAQRRPHDAAVPGGRPSHAHAGRGPRRSPRSGGRR